MELGIGGHSNPARNHFPLDTPLMVSHHAPMCAEEMKSGWSWGTVSKLQFPFSSIRWHQVNFNAMKRQAPPSVNYEFTFPL